MSKLIDITGRKFGKLTAISISHKADRVFFWNCICDCGVEYVARGKDLKSGNTKSCGCSRAGINKTHGKSRTPIYAIWNSMIARCTNEKHKYYHRYGGRGISVCERWKTFEHFYADMSDAPKSCSIDRIDNNGSYEPKNCRWATKKEQSNNTARNVFIEFNGESKTMAQWADITGIDPYAIARRLNDGWSVERILTTPSTPSTLNEICIGVIKYLNKKGISIARLALAHNVSRYQISKAITA